MREGKGRDGLLLPPLECDVDNDDEDDVAAGGTPAAIGTWAMTNTASLRGNIFLCWGAHLHISG